MTELAVQAATNDGWHGGWAWWPIFPLLWFLFFVLVVLLIFRPWAWRRHGWGPGGWGPGGWGDGGAERVLGERFARGEVDEQEYRARLEVLRSGSRRS